MRAVRIVRGRRRVAESNALRTDGDLLRTPRKRIPFPIDRGGDSEDDFIFFFEDESFEVLTRGDTSVSSSVFSLAKGFGSFFFFASSSLFSATIFGFSLTTSFFLTGLGASSFFSSLRFLGTIFFSFSLPFCFCTLPPSGTFLHNSSNVPGAFLRA